MRRVEVTGHRGAAGVEPENTLRGIRYAISLGVGRVEIDVHLTSDAELVVIHDATVDRTTDGSGKVAEMTLAQIRRLDAGGGEGVPTLAEVLELFQDSAVVLQIELKGEGTAAPVAALLLSTGMADRVVLTCFGAARLDEAKHLLPSVPTGFLSGRLDPDPVEVAKRVGADAVHLHHSVATQQIVDRAHAEGLEVRLWNIDEPDGMRRAIGLGVEGIGSNRPDLLLEVLGRT